MLQNEAPGGKGTAGHHEAMEAGKGHGWVERQLQLACVPHSHKYPQETGPGHDFGRVHNQVQICCIILKESRLLQACPDPEGTGPMTAQP